MMGAVTEAPSKGLVLVVEDERPIADLVRMYLSRDGFGVHVEHDGTAGLAAARRVRPVACILDIALPGLEGTEIVRRMREEGASHEVEKVGKDLRDTMPWIDQEF